MKVRTRQILSGCLAAASPVLLTPFLTSMSPAFAQVVQPVQTQNVAAYSQQELDQMLAPVALYQDSLLSQILMAATYPLEIVQAARWSRANPGMSGDQAVRAVDPQNWDPSVKSLVAFPQIIQLMDSSLEWTERLGNAFLSQEAQVWDTVQTLRQRADAAGNLQSNEQVRVIQDGPTYVIESQVPDVIYVPYYDPYVIYGNWWWPGYLPMRWGMWPGYYDVRPGYGRGYYWGPGIGIGIGFFFGGVDWYGHRASIVNRNSFYYRNVNPRLPAGGGWQHDPDHRHGVPYRDPRLRQQFTHTPGTPTTPDIRRDYRGRVPGNGPGTIPGRGNDSNFGAGTGAGNFPRDHGSPRPPVQGTNSAPGVGNPSIPRPSYDPGAQQYRKQQGVQGSTGRPYPDPAPHALEGISRGQEARDASTRGQASLPARPPVQYRQPPASSPQPSPQVQPHIQPQIPRSAPQPAPYVRQQPAPQTHQQPTPQPQQQQQQPPHRGGKPSDRQ